jgi:hypothetical protein
VKRLKAGPELKMPDFKNMKVPQPLVDLYWDLRDRHLLPVVGLVLVGIVAVPFLLGGSKEEPAAPLVPGAGAPSPEPIAGASGSRLTVVQAEPGLRDYKKRLKDDRPTNPFKQRYTGPVLAGTKLGNGEGGGGGSGTSTSTVTTTTGGGEGSSGGSGGGEGGSGGGEGGSTPTAPGGTTPTLPGGGQAPNPGELVGYAWAIDVQVTHISTKKNGGKESSGPTMRKRVLPYSGLPSDKVPVVVYMGPNPETHLPMLLVSDGVDAIFGEAKCLSGDETCQLLEPELGIPTTFSYGPDHDRYKLNVTKIYRTVISREHINREMRQSFSK